MQSSLLDASVTVFQACEHVSRLARQNAFAVCLLSVGAVALFPETALAAVDQEVSSLTVRLVNWGCGILGTLSVWSVARAGYAFQGEDPHDAIPRLKRNIIGLVITFGAIGIVQFIKSAFTQQRL